MECGGLLLRGEHNTKNDVFLAITYHYAFTSRHALSRDTQNRLVNIPSTSPIIRLHRYFLPFPCTVTVYRLYHDLYRLAPCHQILAREPYSLRPNACASLVLRVSVLTISLTHIACVTCYKKITPL
jgi:hypothetical protein